MKDFGNVLFWICVTIGFCFLTVGVTVVREEIYWKGKLIKNNIAHYEIDPKTGVSTFIIDDRSDTETKK